VTAPVQSVEAYLKGTEVDWRKVAEGEWGISVEAAGWPLHIGLALRDGLLRAQAEVVGRGQVSDHELLFRNRSLMFVRYAHTGAGDVWVHGELPPELVTPVWLDRLLGLLVDAATVARQRASVAAGTSESNPS
jgi:hypothetical protein